MRSVFILALAGAVTVPALVRGQSSSRSDEARIRELEQEYIAARQRNDSAALARIVGPGFFSIASTGWLEHRAFLLSHMNVTPGGAPISRMVIDSVEVHMLAPDAAVLVGRRLTTSDSTHALRFMHVFVKRDGAWRLEASSVTAVEPGRAPPR